MTLTRTFWQLFTASNEGCMDIIDTEKGIRRVLQRGFSFSELIGDFKEASKNFTPTVNGKKCYLKI